LEIVSTNAESDIFISFKFSIGDLEMYFPNAGGRILFKSLATSTGNKRNAKKLNKTLYTISKAMKQNYCQG
jgi:hypothetical protein